ncbi:hypothetical protein V8E53_003072 [Lactarius tabidus]
MSTSHETIDVFNPGIGHNQYPPQSAQNQPLNGVSDFVDGSGPIFSMYLEMATEEDKKMAENWKADADGILIFTGLFSAAVATLISVSIQDIRPNPQDTSNFYLSNIYKTIADPNASNISNSLPASPPPFSPPSYAVWVNALWFLSLLISLTCALLVTLLQQWARRYLKVTQSRYSPHKRARIRAFFAEGVEKCLLPWAVEALPTLLHISLFLFFAGLVLFLYNVNMTIFKFALSWAGLCTALYGCLTFMPIFRYDSPYHTPLALLVWHAVTGISFAAFRVLQWFSAFLCFSSRTYDRVFHLEYNYHQLFAQGLQKTAEDTALKSPAELDARSFMWTFDCLDEDHELERFFSGLSGFRSSKVVRDPLLSLTADQKWTLYEAFDGLLDRTFSSELLPAPVKTRRAMICAKAMDPHVTGAYSILNKILSKYQYRGPLATEILQVVSGWGAPMTEDAALYSEAIISMIVARVRPRDDSWFILASNALGVPEAVLRDYATDGDSLSLAILIHAARLQFNYLVTENPWPYKKFAVVLEAASRFNVLDTSPELQRDFCALWNRIVLKAQNDDDQTLASFVLVPIRHIYISLHQDTDSAPTRFCASTGDRDQTLKEPSSYPLCNVPGNHLNSTAHIHDDPVPTTMACAVPDVHDNATPVPSFLASSPQTPFSSTLTPLPVHEALPDALLVPVSSLPVHQVTTESPHIPAAFPKTVTTHAIHRGIDASPRTAHLSTSETLAYTLPPESKSSTFSPDAMHAAVSHTVSGDLNVP